MLRLCTYVRILLYLKKKEFCKCVKRNDGRNRKNEKRYDIFEITWWNFYEKIFIFNGNISFKNKNCIFNSLLISLLLL